jgi:hypothetical protein
MALYAGGAVVGLCGWWLFADSGTKPTGPETPKGGQQISVSTDDLGARNLSEKEWIAMSENRLQAQDNQLRRMAGQGDQLAQLQTQLDALRSENSNMAADGTKVVSAYEDENRNLRQQLAAAQSGAASAAAAGPRALYGAGGPSSYQGFGAGGVPGIPAGGCPRSNSRSSASPARLRAPPAPPGPPIAATRSIPTAPTTCRRTATPRRASSSASMPRPMCNRSPIPCRWSCASPARRARSRRTARC